MSQIKLYAIYHKPTQTYMPARMFATTTAGWSWWEPTGINGLGGLPGVPRLFTQPRLARVALTAWLKGPTKIGVKHINAFETTQKATHETPYQPRRLKDMEIHEIQLTITRLVQFRWGTPLDTESGVCSNTHIGAGELPILPKFPSFLHSQKPNRQR